MPKPAAPDAGARKLIAESRKAAQRLRTAARKADDPARAAGLRRAAEIYDTVARDKAREIARG